MSVVPKAVISTMQEFQTILVLNVWQCSQRHSLVTCTCFQQILVLNACPVFPKGTHQYHAKGFKQNWYSMYASVPKGLIQYHARVFKQYQYSIYVSVPNALFCNMQGFSNNISTQCMSVFQRHSLVTCQGFKHYYYSMYVNVAKETHQYPCKGYQTILVLNVCQCFQRHSLVPCKCF